MNETGWPLNTETWIDDALCAEVDTEAFYPDKGGNTRAAKAICARCDVRADCLDYALRHNETFGIWGGLAPRERHKLQPEEHPGGTLDDEDAA